MLHEKTKQQNYCYRNDLFFIDSIHDRCISVEEFTDCGFLLLSLSFLMFFYIRNGIKEPKMRDIFNISLKLTISTPLGSHTVQPKRFAG